jgi:hypothetical protein
MASQVQIYNMALRLLGGKKLTATTDDVEDARILNDVYEMVRDEVLAAHPWNFAIKRASLTELGGTITTWTAQGTTNVWQATLTTEPASVKFNGTAGTEKTSVATLTAANYWYWASNVLYVYSTSDPDTAYTSPGIEAVIPEFGYDHAYSLPTGCLRVIRMEDDDAVFVREEARLLTDEDSAKIQYIAQITDTTTFTPAFVTAFAARLAAEIAFPLTNSATSSETMYKLYLDKLKIAKGVDAQEGSAQQIDTKSWEETRK